MGGWEGLLSPYEEQFQVNFGKYCNEKTNGLPALEALCFVETAHAIAVSLECTWLYGSVPDWRRSLETRLVYPGTLLNQPEHPWSLLPMMHVQNGVYVRTGVFLDLKDAACFQQISDAIEYVARDQRILPRPSIPSKISSFLKRMRTPDPVKQFLQKTASAE